MNTHFYIDHVKRERPFTMEQFHDHNNYEIYYLHSGERHYFIQDRTYFVRTGDLVLINRHDLHKTIEPGSNIHERTLINFKPLFIDSLYEGQDLLSSFQSSQHVFSLSTQQRQLIEQLLHKLLYEYKHKPEHYDLLLQATLIQLLIEIKRIVKEYPKSKVDNLMPQNKKAAEIVRYLQYQYQEPIKLETLSEKFQISTYHLCRSFKQYSGFTPIEYIQHIRIKAAQKQLIETQMQIQTIAEEVGFNSMIHFNRVFKQHTGVTPTMYRKARYIK